MSWSGLKLLLDAVTSHSGPTNSGGQPALTAMEMKQKDLEASSFKLLMDEVEFDLEAFRVWKGNMAQHQTQVARQELAWSKRLADEASAAADAYLQLQASALPAIDSKRSFLY